MLERPNRHLTCRVTPHCEDYTCWFVAPQSLYTLTRDIAVYTDLISPCCCVAKLGLKAIELLRSNLSKISYRFHEDYNALWYPADYIPWSP